MDTVEQTGQINANLTTEPVIKLLLAKEGADQIVNNDGSKALVYTEKNYLEFQQEDWKKYINENLPKFEGNIDNASKLLMAVTKGVKETCKDKEMDSMLPFALVNSEGIINASFIVNDEYGILIRLSQLERDSLVVGSDLSIQRKTGEIVFTGKMEDFYELVGAEESHHHWYRSQHKTDYDNKEPTEVSVVEYDSKEIEFQALEWQLNLSVKKSMPDPTIKLLRERYENAKEFRAKNQQASKL